MTAVDSKDTDVSDTDSGIIVHSGPDSPSSPLKDVSTHTRALKLKHQALEESLELCLLELRKLCIREAELTGELSSDYPLMPEEGRPRVRRRIGAQFKLDEGLICQDGEDPELHSLEADLALQSQIMEAARRLSQENHLSKPQKKSRLQQCKREERKLKDLQEAVTRQRARSQMTSHQSAGSAHSLKDASMSDDSSLSDVVALDDDLDPHDHISAPARGSPHPDPPQQQAQGQTLAEHEPAPIQNSPWKESSLDQPYQKVSKPQSACSSRSSSPVGSPVYPDRILPAQFIKSLSMRHQHSCSAPSTPELHVRRQYSQSFRLPKNKLLGDVQPPGSEGGRLRPRLPQRRCAADFVVRCPAEASPRRPYASSSEDSSSEHSASSQTTGGPPSPTGGHPRPCPPPYGFHLGSPGNGPVTAAHNNNNSKNNNLNNNVKNNSNRNGPARGEGLWPQERSRPKPIPPPRMSSTPQPQRSRPEEGFPSPGRAMKAPPPPYSRLVRTPSLNGYPDPGSPVMPREVVSEELKSWHQRNKLQRFQPGSGDRLGRPNRVISPASPRPPPYKLQGQGSVILQRAADGTPVQWFVEEDAEIVSQV